MAKKRANKRKTYIQRAIHGSLPKGPMAAAGIVPSRDNRMIADILRGTNFNILNAVGYHVMAGAPIPYKLYYNIVKCNHEFFKMVRAPRYGLANMAFNGIVYPNTMLKEGPLC